MKVALVCPYDLGSPGGVQDQVVKLSHWLADLGHDGTVIGPGDNGPPGAVLIGSVRVIKANAASTPITLSPRAAARLKEAVEDADVVHIHEPLMPIVSMSASRIASKPTVGTFHADPPLWARRGYAALSPVLKRVIARLDVITTVSPVSRSAIESFANARVIGNGIDVARYAPTEKVPGTIAFLGRDDPRKGLDVLLDAWPAVRDVLPEASLCVMGADRGDPPEGVTYLGRVGDAVKYRELARAAVFVAPNLGGESFGITVAEGMAAGCAVVASGIPAFLHVLGEAGAIVAPGDHEGLSLALIRLLEDDEYRDHLGSAARERVMRYDGAGIAAQYVETYSAAIEKHPV